MCECDKRIKTFCIQSGSSVQEPSKIVALLLHSFQDPLFLPFLLAFAHCNFRPFLIFPIKRAHKMLSLLLLGKYHQHIFHPSL